MADLLRTGVGWLKDQLQAHASRTVVYRRGVNSVSLSATVGQSILKVPDESGGMRIVRTERDYIIAAEDLILSGSVTLPVAGDLIDDATDGKVFEVTPIMGEPVHQSGPQRLLLRVHTKEVDTL